MPCARTQGTVELLGARDDARTGVRGVAAVTIVRSLRSGRDNAFRTRGWEVMASHPYGLERFV